MGFSFNPGLSFFCSSSITHMYPDAKNMRLIFNPDDDNLFSHPVRGNVDPGCRLVTGPDNLFQGFITLKRKLVQWYSIHLCYASFLHLI